MNFYKDFIKTTKAHETLLSVLLLIFIVLPIGVPYSLLPLVNNGIFQAILFILVVSLYFYVNPIISVLATLAALILISRSKDGLDGVLPSEITKMNNLLNLNRSDVDSEVMEYNLKQPSVSLEENMVQKMVPPITSSNEEFSFSAVTDKLHNAENLL
jgi:ABC-type multidrug transport system fused ATPase/permease subunit